MATFFLPSTMADAKQEMNNGSSGSRMVLAKPRLGGFGSSSFAASSSSNTSCNPFGNVLRPPQLKPTSNPFLKVAEAESKTVDDEKETKEVEVKPVEPEDETVAPQFVPLASSGVTSRSANSVPPPPQPANSSSSGFVFGQNLSERVVIKENANNGEASSSEDHSSSNGASELLFSSAAASVKENNQEEGSISENAGTGGAGLAQAAAEYERSHARPPPPAAATTFTGEEEETNVLQISGRLYAWEEGSWRERGRGVVRLNDCSGSTGGARLVARATGSLRVLINTKLWGDMVLQRAGNQSIRLTAMDAAHTVKLFLIMGAPSDMNHLYRELTGRVALSKRAEQTAQHSASQQAAERLEAAETKQNNEHNHKDTDSKETDGQDSPDLSNEDSLVDEDLSKESKPLKRKEPADDETSPKRQCPKIIIE